MKLQYKILITSILFIWTIGICLLFFLPYFPMLAKFAPFVSKNYSLVCHQQTHKLIYFGDYHTFVCSRCSGIYLSMTLMSVMIIFVGRTVRISNKLLFLSVMPILADIVLYTIGIYTYSKIVAFSTGFLLGSVGFLYLYESLVNFIQEIKSTK